MGVLADTQRRPTKVVTEHEGANALIENLRTWAIEIKALGDEVLDLTEENDRFRGELTDAEEQIARLEADGLDKLAALCERVIDFDRGIITQPELVRLAKEATA